MTQVEEWLLTQSVVAISQTPITDTTPFFPVEITPADHAEVVIAGAKEM